MHETHTEKKKKTMLKIVCIYRHLETIRQIFKNPMPEIFQKLRVDYMEIELNP